MGVSIDDIKKLKELTGLGLGDAKSALVDADGDFDKALEALRKKGIKLNRTDMEDLVDEIAAEIKNEVKG